jgi:hypothetical protein
MSIKQIFMDAYREAKIETETKRHLQKGLKLNPKFSYTIIARDENGKVVGKTKKTAGLNTNNFGTLLAGILNASSTTVNVLSTSNTSEAVGLHQNGGASPANFNYANLSSLFIQLGTGTTAPTRADYALETPIAGVALMATTYIAGTGVITGSATLYYSAAVAPSELVLYIKYWASGIGSMYYTVIDHAVFTALPSAVSFTIIYEAALS